MDAADPEIMVTADDLDGRLAFVLGLQGPQYRHELTRSRLARRLAVVSGLPVPRDPEGLEFLIDAAQITQDTILRNGHPPFWTEGHLSNLVIGLVGRELDKDPHRVDRLTRVFFDGQEAPTPRLALAYEMRDLAVVPSAVSLALAHLLARHGYVRLLDSEGSRAPHVEEAPDIS